MSDSPPNHRSVDARLDPASWKAVIAAGPFRFRVVSNSMWPTLRSGDMVLVEPLEREPAAGEIVVFVPDPPRTSGSTLTIHRFLGSGRCRGDNRIACDPPVPAANLVGTTRRLERAGHERLLPGSMPPLIRLYRVWVWARSGLGVLLRLCSRAVHTNHA